MTAVGVPEISPFPEFSDNPVGSAGETDQDVTVPPVEDGVVKVISVSLVNVNESGLYVIDGATSFTAIVTVSVALPPLLLAVTV